MHLVANLKGTLQGLDLLCRLLLAHLRYGKHQVQRLALVEHIKTNAKHIGNRNLELCAIWGQVVYGAILLDSLAQNATNICQGEALLYTYLGCLIGDGGHRACPDDILDCEVIAKEHSLA